MSGSARFCGYPDVVNRFDRSKTRARTSTDHAVPDNRLALMDQAFYAGHRAAGQNEVMQVVWVYDRPIDHDGIRRLHRNLASGALGRRIERSPLPFGRYRWVADVQPPALDVTETPRPRAEFADWLDERVRMPIDPESGPGWRLSVVPFTDGTSALTIVLSHYVVDGIGAVGAITLAIMGDTSGYDYPPPQSRSRLKGSVQDLGDTLRETPVTARALVAALKEARRRRNDVARPQAPQQVAITAGDADELVTIPGIWIRLNLSDWTARAEALGGTTGAFAAAMTAKFDELMGRDHGDAPDVKVLLLVNDRTQGDARAVAVSFARVGIEPSGVTSDLSGVRAAIKDAVKTLRETPDESEQFVALAPFTTKRTWKQLIDYALSDPERPAVCSNLGEVGPVVSRPDGTLCDHAFIRGSSQHLTREWRDRMGSQLQLFCGLGAEVNKVGIHVRAYQPGSLTTTDDLRELAVKVLAEFGLAGEIE
ncbi:conserved hypothetical protein [uncultured Mycobacterium sp.]|uniref:Diacylglycerol O-acyltransferase n=1 Tax=uncultured Mycobacterium sp. TaxID=171292 RepID=A0A1Y5PA33_9MYCO|nr:conserved hypothetical protein [uncultured Mycobacterium sp.]SBS75718.1 conserved hypothetical protein [uncultured Mycobacterium sp.]